MGEKRQHQGLSGRTSPARRLLIVLLVGLLASCSSVGPRSIRRDQVDYADSLSDAAKRQILLNIVKLRYGDFPSFVNVSQLVAGYQVYANLALGTELLDFGSGAITFGNDANFTLQGSFTDNPTVTYTPLSGQDYARVLLRPLPPVEIFSLLTAGVPASLALGLGLTSIAGYRNERSGFLGLAPADDEFVEIIRLTAELLADDRLTVAVHPGDRPQQGADADKIAQPDLILEFQTPAGQAAAAPVSETRLRALLELSATQRTFKLVYGAQTTVPGEIAVRTRSLIQIMSEIGAGVRAPNSAIRDNRTQGPKPRSAPAPLDPQIVIHSTDLPPLDAFTAARYGNTWFYIDDTDFNSKRVFTFVMLLFALAESSRPGQLPVLTIPTG